MPKNNVKSLLIPEPSEFWAEMESELRCASQEEPKVVEVLKSFIKAPIPEYENTQLTVLQLKPCFSGQVLLTNCSCFTGKNASSDR